MSGDLVVLQCSVILTNARRHEGSSVGYFELPCCSIQLEFSFGDIGSAPDAETSLPHGVGDPHQGVGSLDQPHGARAVSMFSVYWELPLQHPYSRLPLRNTRSDQLKRGKRFKSSDGAAARNGNSRHCITTEAAQAGREMPFGIGPRTRSVPRMISNVRRCQQIKRLSPLIDQIFFARLLTLLSSVKNRHREYLLFRKAVARFATLLDQLEAERSRIAHERRPIDAPFCAHKPIILRDLDRK